MCIWHLQFPGRWWCTPVFPHYFSLFPIPGKSVPPASFGKVPFISSGWPFGNAEGDPSPVLIMHGPHLVHRSLVSGQRIPEDVIVGRWCHPQLHILSFILPLEEVTNTFLRNDKQSTAISPTLTPQFLWPHQKHRCTFYIVLRAFHLVEWQTPVHYSPQQKTKSTLIFLSPNPFSVSLFSISDSPTL